jgi:cell division protein FtsQ
LEIEAGFERINADQIRAAVGKHSGAGFFAVKLDRVRRSLESLPGVESAEVRKRWPDTLIARVVERRAVATWPGRRLVGSRGELFGPFEADLSEGLPALSGPDDRAGEVLEFYRASVAALDAGSLRVAAVHLTERGSWSLELTSGGTLVIGREDARARLERFLAAWSRLPRPPGAALKRADLRYANGFAVEWLQPPAAEAPASAPQPSPRAETPPAPTAADGTTPSAEPSTRTKATYPA